MMDQIEELESASIYVIREAFCTYKKIAVLWSMGKDSTTLIHLIRKSFFGKVPFPVIHVDTSYKFAEMYTFRDFWAQKWDLDLIVTRNEEALSKGCGPKSGDRFDCCTDLKTQALKQIVRERGLDAVLLGIRRDEHGIRAKERVFSPRNSSFEWDYLDQPPEIWDVYNDCPNDEDHTRVHPLLPWSEADIWRYIRREKIPVHPLYFSRDGKRYRSIGCEPCCTAVPSTAADLDAIIRELDTTTTAERSGRAQDKEHAYMMQKLRALGYM